MVTRWINVTLFNSHIGNAERIQPLVLNEQNRQEPVRDPALTQMLFGKELEAKSQFGDNPQR